MIPPRQELPAYEASGHTYALPRYEGVGKGGKYRLTWAHGGWNDYMGSRDAIPFRVNVRLCA